MRCGRIFSASGDGQFRRGCGAYSTGALGGDRAEAASIAIELSLDRHADARNSNRSRASTRGAAVNDACAPQPHSQSVLASSGLMHEDAGRRSEWSWRHALQFRVHLRKRERGPAFDGRSTGDAEPSLQLNNRPPSLGGFPKHQHLPCPRAPVARQLFGCTGGLLRAILGGIAGRSWQGHQILTQNQFAFSAFAPPSSRSCATGSMGSWCWQ